jgi:hypothetical protein
MNEQYGYAAECSRTPDAMLGVDWEVPTLFPRGGRSLNRQSGKIGWAILWLLGIPLPLLLVAYLIWGR